MGYNPMMGMQQSMMAKGGPMMGGPMMGGKGPMMGGGMMPNPQMQQMQMMQMMQQKGAMGGKGMPGKGLPQAAPQPQAATQAAPGGALNAAALAAAPPQVQKQMIGEKLYPMIAKYKPAEAGKITGMMLEMDNSELLMLLESEAQLKTKVDEAIVVLGGQ